MDKSLSTFHGFTVIMDEDCENVRNNYVVETNFRSQIIYCYYDENGDREETILANLFTIFPIKAEKLRYSQVLNVIKQSLKCDDFLISESAVDYIKSYVDILNQVQY